MDIHQSKYDFHRKFDFQRQFHILLVSEEDCFELMVVELPEGVVEVLQELYHDSKLTVVHLGIRTDWDSRTTCLVYLQVVCYKFPGGQDRF